jgi:hypothetical protein
MNPNLAVSLDRADELLEELLAEYDRSLQSKAVSPRAVQLTHEVCERLRSVLDRVARRYWDLHIAPHLSEDDRKAANVYFPIAPDQNGLDSILGRWRWKADRQQHQGVYDFLLKSQPFSGMANAWLSMLSDLAVKGKHIDLVPQKRTETRRITVSRPGMSVSWDPDAVRFGSGPGVSIHIAGARIDPVSQRIEPTPGVEERIETWVSFNIEGHNVNAAGFCKEACQKTRQIVTEMTKQFGLS